MSTKSSLPTSLWGAINRAKLDIRKYHLETNEKKREKLRENALLSIANADKVVGPGPHRYMSSRGKWKNEILYLHNGDEHTGAYWPDDKEHWNIDTVPEWAVGKSLKIQEPTVGSVFIVRGKPVTYEKRPPHVDR